ncbi:dynamin family protein [Burkholderia cepacia]|uniref:dynamin family protein n=1 Tax=Burkholderia cepacia TaxID=292 RepID=UPI002990232E|nr:dynamin family protein [Burkholderia cepacia]MDW9233773.1 dynamin family protein [Burkholderia cepacia]
MPLDPLWPSTPGAQAGPGTNDAGKLTSSLHWIFMQRARAGHAELGKLIDQIRTIISSDDSVGNYFDDEHRWLNDRERIWRNDVFRIGLMGVTSSGKSTLVNALLGAELLPRAVRPSSNSLVVCEWGERFECTIHFNARGVKPKLLTGSTIAKRLKSYADEETNPGNREGVEEIRLRSPDFRFRRGIALIDTPGLDAAGHDAHEQLTLEVLLPTVDVVVFVTTCKANSDEKMRDYVCMADELGKPIVVVQNMIDSVVAKLGPKGDEQKSRTEVLAEHRRRVAGVLGKAGLPSVPICQISARMALEQWDDRSGVPECVGLIQRQLDALAPAIAEGRRRQLDDLLNKVIDRELKSGDQAAVLRRQCKEAERLSVLRQELAARYAWLCEEAERESTDRTAEADVLRSEAAMLTATGIDAAYALKASVEKWQKQSVKALSELNKRLNVRIAEDCETLNLRMEDIDLAVKLARPASTLQFETAERSRTVKTEQSSSWGWLKRKVDFFDQNWGYNERTENWTEIRNIDAFRKAVEQAIGKELDFVDGFVEAAVKRIKQIGKQFKDEIAAQERGVRAKMSAASAIVQRKAIAQQLEALLVEPRQSPREPREPRADADVAPMNVPVVEPEWHDIDVPAAVVSMARLAKLISRWRFPDLRDQVLTGATARRSRDGRRVLILGYDADSLGDFVNRFWFDALTVDAGRVEGFASQYFDEGRFDQIAMAVPNADALDKVHDFLTSPCVIFLMLDIQQIGATKSALDRSGIRYRALKHPVVAVVQSIRELEQSDSIAEALRELKTLCDERDYRLAGALVNDEKDVYSMLANRLLVPDTPFATFAEEQQFIGGLPEYNRKDAVAIIRSWKAVAA